MKKISSLILVIYITVSAMGQIIRNERINSNLKRHEIKNSHEFFNKEKKNEIQHLKQLRINKTPQLKSVMTGKQKLDSCLAGSWDESLNWIPNKKYEYAYDANGNMILYIEYHLDESTNDFIPVEKGEYSYNLSGNYASGIEYERNESSNQWVEVNKNECKYDVNGFQTQYLHFEWLESVNQWDTSEYMDYVFDDEGNMITIKYFGWDELTSSWVLDMKEDLTYEGGNISTEIYSGLDESTSSFIPFYKLTFHYDVNNNIDLISYDENFDGTTWYYSKEEFFYDANGNMTYFIEYKFDMDWIANFKEEYTYNNSYSFEDLILPFYDNWEANNHHMRLQNIEFDFIDDVWVSTWKEELYYSAQIITLIDDYKKSTSLEVFPNPANDNITLMTLENLENCSIEFYNTDGRKVQSQLINNKTSISLQNLNKGLYFYKIFGMNGVLYTGKIIKN